ncbi:unnamed protein product [Oppiella nova]|uniref:ABC transporter domain-containing protein n=1 Tax=Oppiella nova TaxID=334625 RepID=A0A7R9MG43_9ACAR|nr:unnamed protein product [Oppiella nova]CAG2175777.1 unnamed protein product [Oppiella nova]
MNLKIEEGKIFGLLGSNGSGKTTLLRLILGRLKPHSGHVSIFGEKPGTKYSDVPGPGVGYMPQEVALYYEFTIAETLTYYGLLSHMSVDAINNRINVLTDLLSIPDRTRVLSKLSGGQQRLVSMAVTMIHNPRLLILDEPTVGVDSLIRQRIWAYLENISKNDGVTIIVTTHYIEEAKSSSFVGFVSNGYLLAQSSPQQLMDQHRVKTLEETPFPSDVTQPIAVQRGEGSPQQLMDQYRVKTLEEVYYKLAIIRRRSRRMSLNPLLFNEERDAQEVETENKKFNKSVANDRFLSLDRMSALLWRNYLKLTRSPLMFICFYILTALIITLMSLVFNQNFNDLPIAIYNGEQPPELTDLFMQHIDKHIIDVKLYNSSQEAMESVISGNSIMSLEFSTNFSLGVDERFQSPQDVSEQAILDSQVKLVVDMSRPITTGVANLALLKTLNSFIKNYSLALDYNPMAYTLPFDFNAIYYSFDPSFKDFIAPGMLLAIQYGLNMVLTGFIFIYEQKGGCLERCFVTGVKPIEIILVQVLWFTAVLVVQAVLSLVLSFYVFNFTITGSLWDVLLMLILQGIHGMIFGMITSLTVHNDYNVMMVMVLTTLPLWMISGLIWPLESLSDLAQSLCRFLPLTIPTESMRAMMFRGLSSIYAKMIHLSINEPHVSVAPYVLNHSVLKFTIKYESTMLNQLPDPGHGIAYYFTPHRFIL